MFIRVSKFMLIISPILCTPVLSVEETGGELWVRCRGLFDLCGYVDSETEEQVIEPRFERAHKFHEGLAAVRVAGLYGFIHRGGRMVIEPQFDLAGSFYQGIAEIVHEGKAGVVDRRGRIVVAPKFARAIPFTKDVLIVIEGDWKSSHIVGFERLDGLFADEFLREEPLFLGRRPFGLYHVRKGWIQRPRYLGARIFGQQGKGLIWASANPHGGPWGLLRADGTWQVEPIYHEVQPLQEGRAVVSVTTTAQGVQGQVIEIELWGAVDETGKLVIPAVYDYLKEWTQGYGVAQKGRQEALIRRDGTLLGGRFFDEAEWPRDGQLARVKDNGRWFSVTADGKLVADERDGQIVLQCPQGLTVRRTSENYRLFDGKGRPISPDEFDYVDSDGVNCDEPISVSLSDRYGYVTPDAKLLTDPPIFENQHSFRGGHAAVKKNGKWGFIDVTGAFVVEPIFDELDFDYPSRTFKVKRGARTFYVNTRGEEVAGPDLTARRRERLQCAGGGRKFKKDGLWGFMGPDGKTIIEPEYRAISCFRFGVVLVPVDEKRGWCQLGPDGKLRSRSPCDQTWYPVWASHHSPEVFDADPYESSVLWVRAWLDYGLGERDTEPRLVPW